MTATSQESRDADRMECPFCKADFSAVYDRGVDAVVEESCDHFLALVDICCDTVYGPLADHITAFVSLVEDAFATKQHAEGEVTWDNLLIQRFWERVQELGVDNPGEGFASLSPEDLYHLVLGFLEAAGGELVGPSMYSPATWRSMYAANPQQTIEGGFAMLRSELEQVSVAANPPRKRRR